MYGKEQEQIIHIQYSFQIFDEIDEKEYKAIDFYHCHFFLVSLSFAGLTSNANNILERQNNLYEKTNLADVYVTTTGLTDDDRTAMRTLYNIDLIEERIYLTANVKNSNVYFVSTEASPKLSHPLIKEGEEGCLMMNSFMKDKELSIGDKVSFTMTNPLK